MKLFFCLLLTLNSVIPSISPLAAVTDSARPLFEDTFAYPDGLLTNEYAYFYPNNPGVVKTSNWELTSGSLFASGGAGWTGVPDGKTPDAKSILGNHSVVFRMKSKRKNFGQVAVSFSLLNQGFTTSPSTPPLPENGVHFFLRYQSETHVYYGSINRRDGNVIIKKKMPGGPSNGGTYYNVSPSVPYSIPFGKWQSVRATVFTNPNGSVTIELFANGKKLVSATDKGIGGPPITKPGAVGIRCDNDNVKFKNFMVSAIGASSSSDEEDEVVAAAAVPPVRVSPVPWRSDHHSGQPVTFGDLASDAKVQIFTVAGHWVTTIPAIGTTAEWDLTNNSGEKVASGLYVYLAKGSQGDVKGVLGVVQ